MPPNSAGTRELRASPPAGATPMQPKTGLSGILRLNAESWAVKVAVLVARSMG